MTEPTGQEHLTPVRIVDTSATERGGFRRCRRQWFLAVVHRLDAQEGNVNFFLGRIYHSALEAYYKSLMGPLQGMEFAEEAALDAYQVAYDLELANMKAQLGMGWEFGGQQFRDAGELGIEMLQNYLDRERVDPLLDTVLAVEFRVRCAIPHPVSGKRAGWLSVQADVVGVKDDELVVVDHKTASRMASSAHLDLDDQLTAEVYSWWKATGDFPERAIYNVSMKRVPKPPKLLKSGKLSRAVGQDTTVALYRQAIVDNGLNIGDYIDIIVALEAREASGEDKLFMREATIRTPGQMSAFERDLFYEYKDMRDVALHPEKAYPNPTSMNCTGCPVRLVCTTIQDDGNVAAVIKAGYIVADPRR